MPLLYYWRGDNYRRDLDPGAGYHLNQGSPRLHDIELGDSLWAFTRLENGRYVLAAELVVRAKTFNPPRFRYGRYRLWEMRRELKGGAFPLGDGWSTGGRGGQKASLKTAFPERPPVQ